jgi:hypothetical protein
MTFILKTEPNRTAITPMQQINRNKKMYTNNFNQ